jgi:hypothetical protein
MELGKFSEKHFEPVYLLQAHIADEKTGYFPAKRFVNFRF